MQLDPPPSERTIWDWHQNISDGLGLLQVKFGEMSRLWNRQVSQFETYNLINGANISPPKNVVVSDVTFSYNPQPGERPILHGL